MSWINDLDACASAGIINFDGPSFITGAQPRYFGNPQFETLPDELMPQMRQQPQKDIYTYSKKPQKYPTWKKVLFGALALGGFVLGAKNFKAIKGFLGKLSPKKLVSKIKTVDFKAIPQKIGNFFKNGFDKIKNIFKKKP